MLKEWIFAYPYKLKVKIVFLVKFLLKVFNVIGSNPPYQRENVFITSFLGS